MIVYYLFHIKGFPDEPFPDIAAELHLDT